MRHTFSPLLAVTCLAAAGITTLAASPARLVDTTGGFSYVPPAGWRVGTLPGAKYKIAYAKPVNGFAPNINVVDETAPMTVAEYARLNLLQLQKQMPGFHLLGQASFVTSAGLQGIKMIAESAPMGKKLRQTFYLLPKHGDQKLVVTASWLASEGGKYSVPVDAAIKTFAVK